MTKTAPRHTLTTSLAGLIMLTSLFAPALAADKIGLVEAQELYEDNCAMCHGYDGMPIMPGAPNFTRGERLEKKDTELLTSIRDGKGAMPPWAGALSDAEQQAALHYARQLHQPPAKESQKRNQGPARVSLAARQDSPKDLR